MLRQLLSLPIVIFLCFLTGTVRAQVQEQQQDLAILYALDSSLTQYAASQQPPDLLIAISTIHNKPFSSNPLVSRPVNQPPLNSPPINSEQFPAC